MAILDTATASTIIDLISLIEQRGATRLHYQATTDSGQYHGPCPFCGGTDRFLVWPHRLHPGYACMQCGMKGDAIQFLRDYEDMTFREACEELGLDLLDAGYIGTPAPASSDQAPPKKWIDLMSYIVETGNKILLAGSSHAAREYYGYLSQRGITLETVEEKKISFAAIGSTGRWLEIPFADVGITEDMIPETQWKKGCIRIPDGLIFPYYVNGDLWKLGIKRPSVTNGTMQRGQILGSKECLLNEDMIMPGKGVIMTEAFLDAVSIEQVAGDLIVPISTDGTSNGRSARCQMRLKYADYTLSAFDNDDAGHASAAWWGTRAPNCIRWPVVHGKDANEMLQDGRDVRQWVEQGIARITHRDLSEPASVPTGPTVDVCDLPYLCAICHAEVARYTPKGTPCCAKHYAGQAQIEHLLDGYQTSCPVMTPEQLQARYIFEIKKLVGPCEVEIYPGDMPIKHIIALRSRELHQQAVARAAAMQQKAAWSWVK